MLQVLWYTTISITLLASLLAKSLSGHPEDILQLALVLA